MLNKRLGLSVFLAIAVVFLMQGSTDSQRPVASQVSAAAPQIQNLNQLPLYFIENAGQLDESIAYHLKMSGGNVHFARDSIRYQFIANALQDKPSERQDKRDVEAFAKDLASEEMVVRFEGASDSIQTFGVGEHKARFNFYQGAEPESWIEGAQTFAKVKYKNLYSGIDMVVYESKGLLKQEYRVRPGGSVSEICVAYEGVQSVLVNDRGQLEILTHSRTLVEDTPVSYQIVSGNKVFIDTKYVVGEGNKVRFEVGDYDDSKALVIDPSLIYSTFLGGPVNDWTRGIAIDLHLNAYVCGTYLTEKKDRYGRRDPDIFIAKLDSTGSELLFFTNFGGSNRERASGIVFSWDDESPVVVGVTMSDDCPTTPGAYDRSLGGSGDIFVAKFSSNGVLKHSTYFGGTDADGGERPSVGLDGAGNIYAFANTESSDLPITERAFDDEFDEYPPPSWNAPYNVFVSKFDKTLSSLLYSTFFGGPGIRPGGLSVDYYGNAFITGTVNSYFYDGGSWIPTTPGAYNTEGGKVDGFVASLDPSGTKLNYSTYLGIGWRYKEAITEGIAVDGQGKAFVIGKYDPRTANTTLSAFVIGLNASGRNILFQPIFFGSGRDQRDWTQGRAIAVDGRGGVYTLIETGDPNLETSQDAFQGNLQGLQDLYITKLNTSDGSILHSTYMGGSHSEWGTGLAVDSFGSAYVTGGTYSFDFPTTYGAHSVLLEGSEDAFVARIRDSGPAGELSLNIAKLPFKKPYESNNTLKKNFRIQNKGKGVVNYDISTNQKWLAVYPTSGDVRNEQDNIVVFVTPKNLKPGTHQGIVKVSSIDAFNSPAQLLVNLKVKGPTIRVKRKKYSLKATEGSTTPIVKANKIKNRGPGTLSYKLKSLESWIKVKPKRGTSTGEWDEFSIEVDPTGMAAGIHQGIIQVISKDTLDSPVDITITLNIKAEE